MISLQPPSDLELQQVPGATFPPVRAASGAHVPSSSNLTPPIIPNEALHLPSNSAPPNLVTQQLSNSAATVLPTESGGVTVPTAETAADGVDVEDGVEVLFTPQEPFVGMSFNTSDAAKDYDNSCARHTSFSIRIDTSRESKKANEKTKYIYICQKVGANKKEKVADDGPITEKKIVRQRRKDYVDRTHFLALMIVRKTSPGHWEVVHFEREHNHESLRKFSLTKYLKSHRDIPAEEKEFIKLLHECCITTTCAYQIMAELYGGIENCPYIEGDAKNLRVEYRTEYRGKDVKATLEYFEELKKEDPEFYYSYTLDEFDRVENLFWVDGAARRSYELYSDCLSFDTTYLTNAYNVPCAPFIGIDRNGITIQLGCSFLRNEKTEGFV
ncbi:protein FAR1-RELATED SEQUENCE 5-like [Panicum virgatum]|uniref:protein FAR1-RELATED SEQUENCE 5-like n=1 Tax=Panicum virgatum TaxID=38727 RepID=UPI0019D558F7|nr:protein FAR1-RELATED SEQUENCE 5-like [Panicum virgatum]